MSQAPTEAPNAHVNPPQQARSRRTLERIVRAALDLLDQEGPDGVTVQAVVARARSSVGSFYARFRGKEDLLEYLEERVWREAEQRWQERLKERDWAVLSLEELVRGAVRLLADARRSRASSLRALDRMGAGSGDGYASFRRYVLESLSDLLLERRDQIRHQDPELAVRLALAAIAGAVDSGDPSSGQPFDPRVLEREGEELVVGYLTGSVPVGAVQATTEGEQEEADDDEDVDFFDVWG
jgi:AcrR family transcriptional regulator